MKLLADDCDASRKVSKQAARRFDRRRDQRGPQDQGVLAGLGKLVRGDRKAPIGPNPPVGETINIVAAFERKKVAVGQVDPSRASFSGSFTTKKGLSAQPSERDMLNCSVEISVRQLDQFEGTENETPPYCPQSRRQDSNR